MKMDFNLESKVENNILIIKTEGYINNDGGEEILKEFETHFNNGIVKVLIDIENSKVVNSIGISYLIEIIEKLNDKNGTLYFSNMDSAVEKTFTIMGLFQFAKKVASADEIE
jgi:anti-anti-sigma factor